MKHPYTSLETQSLYAEEQAVFAKMKEDLRIRNRKRRRIRALMWVLRRL